MNPRSRDVFGDFLYLVTLLLIRKQSLSKEMLSFIRVSIFDIRHICLWAVEVLDETNVREDSIWTSR